MQEEKERCERRIAAAAEEWETRIQEEQAQHEEEMEVL